MTLAAVLIASALPAFSQSVEASTEELRFHFGPLAFTPSIALTNVGIDNNVFNNADQAKQDTTASVGPAIRFGMRLGQSSLTGKGSVEYLYFNAYANERALNSDDEVRWQVQFARLIPFVRGRYQNTKNRPGYEIDSRSRLNTRELEIGAHLRLSAKTSVTASAARERLEFDRAETFDEVNLADALNRTADRETLEFRHQLSTLTTLVATADAIQDRFATNAIRSSDSIRVMSGFEMKPSALISGKGYVGFRKMDPLDASVPSYLGVVALVDARYLITGATQLAVGASRDLAYSYQPLEPYYALTDLSIGVTQRVTYSWDVVVGTSRQTLDYHSLATLVQPGPATSGVADDPVKMPPSRLDTIDQYKAGVGYWVGRTFRIGFDGVYYARHSPVIEDTYSGLRFGASVRYGLKP